MAEFNWDDLPDAPKSSTSFSWDDLPDARKEEPSLIDRMKETAAGIFSAFDNSQASDAMQAASGYGASTDSSDLGDAVASFSRTPYNTEPRLTGGENVDMSSVQHDIGEGIINPFVQGAGQAFGELERARNQQLQSMDAAIQDSVNGDMPNLDDYQANAQYAARAGQNVMSGPGMVVPQIGMGAFIGDAVNKAIDEGPAAGMRAATYGPIADFATQDNLGEQFADKPFTTAAAGVMSALPLGVAARLGYKGAKSAKGTYDDINNMKDFNEAADELGDSFSKPTADAIFADMPDAETPKNSTTTTGGGTGGGVDSFMDAISGQESGGNYDAYNGDSGATGRFQIMPENWPSWSRDAGLGEDAPMTAANQDAVAKWKMQQYYDEFGNWRDVAKAWYAGPDSVNWSEEALNRPQGDYPSVNEYADSVMGRMGNAGESSSRPAAREMPKDDFTDISTDDTPPVNEDGPLRDAFGRDEQPTTEDSMRQDVNTIIDDGLGKKSDEPLQPKKPIEEQMQADADRIINPEKTTLTPEQQAYKAGLEDYISQLEAERQQAIDATVDMYKKNPGGQGVDVSPLYNDRMEPTGGRAAVSNNPQWYQDAYKYYGRKPNKSAYEDIAIRELQKTQEFSDIESALHDARKAYDEQIANEQAGRPVQYAHERIDDSEQASSTQDSVETIKKTDILKRAQEMFTPIRTGRIRGGSGHKSDSVLGMYTPHNDVVRLRYWGDLDTASHEIGHAIDQHMNLSKDSRFDSEFEPIIKQRFGGAYKPEEIRGEGIAEFFHDYFSKGPETAKHNFPKFYEQFSKIMSGDKKIAAKVQKMQGMMDRWKNQSAEARGRAAVSYASDREPSRMEKLKNTVHSFVEGWIDDKEALQRAQESYNKLTGKVADTAHDVYKLARLAMNNAVARAQLMVEGKKPAIVRNSINKIYGGKIAGDKFYTIRNILSDLDRAIKSSGKEYADYLKKAGCKNWHEALDTLLVAERSHEIKQVRIKEAEDNLRHIITDMELAKNQIKILEAKRKEFDKSPDDHTVDEYEKIFKGISNAKKTIRDGMGKIPDARQAIKDAQHYKTPINDRDMSDIIDNAPEELHAAADKIYEYNRTIMNILYSTGMVSHDVYVALMQKYKHYVPMMREFADEAGMQEGMGMGGKGFVNVAKAIKSLSDTGSTRQVKSPLENIVVNTYKLLSMAERNRVGQAFAKWSETPGIGKLCEKVIGVSRSKDSTVSVWFKGKKYTFSTTPEIYRALTSMKSPEAVNPIMQLLSAAAGMLRAGATLTPDFAIKNIMRDASGASVFSQYGFRPVIDHAYGIFHMLKQDQLFHDYKASGALMSTMVGLDRDFVQASLKGLYTKDAKYYWNHYNPIQIMRGFSEMLETATRLGEYSRAVKKGASVEDAALSARDVSLDFSKAGTYGRNWNKIAAFFNAGIQEPVRIAQAFKEDPKGTAVKTAMFITLPSVALWYMNHDKEWYKELPDWQKNIFWCFKAGDTVYRIPKPFGLGVVFGSLPERTLDWIVDKHPDAMKHWLKSAGDAFIPNTLPTVVTALVEWNTGYSLFRDRQIVPQREQNLKKEGQYGPNTSSMAKEIGKMFGLSPRKIDNLVQGLGGGMATQSLNAYDYAKGNRDMQNPFSKAFTIDVTRSPQSVQDFYDAYQKSKQEYNSAKLQGGKIDKDIVFNYKTMNRFNQGMAKFNKAERKAAAEHNDAEVNRLNKLEMQLAQHAMSKYRRKE